ncbi:MAG: right-handed parallel beta-helix repeat-containing protein [Phycisphaerales bacterium]
MTRNPVRTSAALMLAAVALCVTGAVLYAGPLDPPAGPVAPTPGPEPRIAINATNTPGDNDGQPSLFKISAPGSYYLTGNITGVTGKHGIEITASGVTLDLNGFDLQGAPGSLGGVFTTGSNQTNIAVVNGSVRNWGGSGVSLGSTSANCRVDSILSSGNGNAGIFVSENTTVTNCSAYKNATNGIDTGSGCVITNCTADENGNYGITPGSGATVAHCSAYNNANSGFSLGAGGTITNCNARSNDTFGIFVGSASTVTDCSASFNNRDGISCSGSGSIIRGNSCVNNGINANDGAGIYVASTDNRVEGNNCVDNDRGIDIDAASNLIIGNSCAGNTVNYEIDAGNRYGLIINITAGGTAAVSGSAAASTLGSTDPHANFSY